LQAISTKPASVVSFVKRVGTVFSLHNGSIGTFSKAFRDINRLAAIGSMRGTPCFRANSRMPSELTTCGGFWRLVPTTSVRRESSHPAKGMVFFFFTHIPVPEIRTARLPTIFPSAGSYVALRPDITRAANGPPRKCEEKKRGSARTTNWKKNVAERTTERSRTREGIPICVVEVNGAPARKMSLVAQAHPCAIVQGAQVEDEKRSWQNCRRELHMTSTTHSDHGSWATPCFCSATD